MRLRGGGYVGAVITPSLSAAPGVWSMGDVLAARKAGTWPRVVWTPERLFTGGRVGVWIDPSDLSTLWRDTSGTVPVTDDGHTVALARDKSGGGNDLTQANISQRLAYKSGGYLTADGVDDVLIKTFGAAKPFPLHIIMGADVVDSINNNIVSFANPASGTAVLAMHVLTGPGAVLRYGTGAWSSAVPVSAGKHVLSGKFYAGNQSISADGGAFADMGSNASAYPNLTRLGLGAFVDSTPFYATGSFYGLIVVFDELSADENAQAVAWMKNKMGI